MFCYAWLAAPPEFTRSLLPGIITFAVGAGFSPRKFRTSMLCRADPELEVLLMIIVPTIVPLKYVSTTLGVQKALEQTGTTIFQTPAGFWLDNDIPGSRSKLPRRDDAAAVQHLLCAFLFFNVLQLISLEGLTHPDIPIAQRIYFFIPDADSDASMHSNPETFHTTPPIERTPLFSHSNNESIAWDPAYDIYRWSERRRGRSTPGFRPCSFVPRGFYS
ncbi:hypothetical protein J3R83DRAFT_6602 [Lanmaoa asiatica]|nr:hypothetical protein J3R83DRAFT_6602 [Lanmaoa asiatica]